MSLTTTELKELQEWRRHFCDVNGKPLTPAAARADFDKECANLQALAAAVSKPVRIVVTMEGGVIQDIELPPGIVVEVWDFDIEGAETDIHDIRTNASGDEYVYSEWANPAAKGDA